VVLGYWVSTERLRAKYATRWQRGDAAVAKSGDLVSF
jgi:hypothetical protein